MLTERSCSLTSAFAPGEQFTEDDGVDLLVEDDDDPHEHGDGQTENLGGVVVGREADHVHRQEQRELKGRK